MGPVELSEEVKSPAILGRGLLGNFMSYRTKAFRRRDEQIARIVGMNQTSRAEVAPVVQAPAVAPEPVVGGEVNQLRADYQELLGKRPYYGWDAAELRTRIESALSSASDAAE